MRMMMKRFKRKVINFVKPFPYCQNFEGNHFYFEVAKEQSSGVTKGMHIFLPTTCHFLEISRHLGQAVKAALLYKVEMATRILSTVSETKYPGSKYYCTFLTISLFLFSLQVLKPGKM